MKFVFHTAYDSELPTKVRTIAEGSTPEAELGLVYGGPIALLRILELHLGIVVNDVSAVSRSIQFLNLLEDRCRNENPFYAESLKVDPIGTSSTLLDWRDQLILANWSGDADPKSSNRLKELSVLHGLALDIAPGIADRYFKVWTSLQNSSLDFLKVESKIPLPKVRGLLGRILKKLGTCEPPEINAKCIAKESTDLHKIQLYLTSDESSSEVIRNPTFQNDGSFVLIEAISDTLLSRYCISGILKWNDEKQLSHAVLAGEAQDVFNIAANASGLPRLMTGDGEGLRGEGAFLHLLIEMAWNPYNVNHWGLNSLIYPPILSPKNSEYALARPWRKHQKSVPRTGMGL